MRMLLKLNFWYVIFALIHWCNKDIREAFKATDGVLGLKEWLNYCLFHNQLNMPNMPFYAYSHLMYRKDKQDG